MTQQIPAPSPVQGELSASRGSRSIPGRNEVTDIIPFNEFGKLDDLDFSANSAFEKEAQVLGAPELDDLDDTDNLVVMDLAGPSASERRIDPASARCAPSQDRRGADGPARAAPQTADRPDSRSRTDRRDGRRRRRRRRALGHRGPGPPKAETVLAAQAATTNGGPISASGGGMQMVTVQPAANVAVHNAELAHGVAFAHERAQREARLQQPLFVMPTKGIFTSGFGYRWGVLHAGIDLANSIGTPIHAVSDGVVIDAGPTAGYGMWVKLRHADGTVTLYGHVNTTTVSVGQRVMAGDQIATMGNRGNSTGPHLHFEVLLGGTQRIDPVPWLAKRGLSVGTFAG